MANRAHLYFNVTDRSYFALTKKDIHHAAVTVGYPAKKIAEADIVVAELVSNLVKHGKNGYLLAKINDEFIELLAIDEGPGITDISRMMQDGVSTSNTLGQGLGAIKRLSDVFQVYSVKGWGTIVLSRMYKHDSEVPAVKARYHVAGLLVCKPGETHCGDGYFIKASQDKIKIFMGDGLGHGIEAEKAVQAAITAVANSYDATAFDTLRTIHGNVRKTRGLVGAMAFLNLKDKVWNVCGIGNINTRIAGHVEVKHYMSYNGVVGLNIPNTMKDQVVPAEKNQVMILCSDGIKTKWDLLRYPNILKYDLSILLAAIFKDNARRTDDMGLVAIKCNV